MAQSGGMPVSDFMALFEGKANIKMRPPWVMLLYESTP
jgi:hypothetical protein